MTTRFAVPYLALAAAIGAPAFGADSTGLVHLSSTQQVAFQSGGTIRVDHSFGELWIQGWDRPDVEITVTKSPDELYSAKNQADAARLAGNVKVTTARPSPNELVIATAVEHYRKWLHPFSFTGDVMMQYRIRVPRDCKLIVHHKDGEVLISDMRGDIEAAGRSGDLVVLLPEDGKYSIDARSQAGTLSSDFAGDFRHGLWSSGFSSPAPAPAHRIYLRERLGGIQIKGSPAEARPHDAGAVQ